MTAIFRSQVPGAHSTEDLARSFDSPASWTGYSAPSPPQKGGEGEPPVAGSVLPGLQLRCGGDPRQNVIGRTGKDRKLVAGRALTDTPYPPPIRRRTMPTEPNQPKSPPSIHKPDRVWTYKTVGDVKLEAHGFFRKEAGPAGSRAAFVFFHPGGWSMGEPAWGYDVCHHYASLGMVAITFQYRLSAAGGHTPVEALADVRSAIRWTRQNATMLGIDPNRLVASGVSAGAHLALCAAMLTCPDDPGDDPAFSPVPNRLALQCAPVNSASDRQFVGAHAGQAQARGVLACLPCRTGPAPHVPHSRHGR